MQQAVAPGAGAMAAVLGLSDEEVVAGCNQAANETQQVVAGVNFNAPGQVVIAGAAAAVARAGEILKEQGARKIIPVPVSVPSHCALMQPAAEKLAAELAKVTFTQPLIPLVQNINGQVAGDAVTLKDGLIKQLYSPVLWTQSITTLANLGVTQLIECGPGKVLSGLNKRINSSANLYNLHTSADLHALAAALA
jgi:[acyl-carrier-protein] S-malonyltransferase